MDKIPGVSEHCIKQVQGDKRRGRRGYLSDVVTIGDQDEAGYDNLAFIFSVWRCVTMGIWFKSAVY
jgi:hypothetical protein